MKRAIGLLVVAVLALASTAQAGEGRANVTVGRAALTKPVGGRSTLLVPVSYPIAFAGRPLKLTVRIMPPDGGAPIRRILHTRASAGPPRIPERRRRFTFVHGLLLGRDLSRDLESGGRVAVRADGRLDVNRDGEAELSLGDSSAQPLSLVASPAQRRICASIPQRRVLSGGRVLVKLPACTGPASWKIERAPSHGRARIVRDDLIYAPASKFRGTDSVGLSGGSSAEVKVGSAQSAVVRAIGDSVTAGFGYYDDGSLMGLLSLLECKPGSERLVDACSSNSATTSDSAKKLEYAPDYGLSNNVSWAAQWANEHGITDFENLAVSGSEPVNWAPEGSLYETAARIEAEDPDYVLMTLGANPLLSEMLFGADNMGCAIYADLFGKYAECIEEAFAKVKLPAELKAVYADLLKKTDATIFLMQYHLSIPATALAYTAFQIAEMGSLLNREIAAVAASLHSPRLQVVAPPHFNVGIDISPVFRSRYSCSELGYEVDGPSVQTDATQDELLLDHPLSFCSGPVTGPPWVISGDTGIHPSAAGYAQMASQVPAPE